MNHKRDISPLVAAHYPDKTPFGTMARPEPPGTAVLEEDGKATLRRDDELMDRSGKWQEHVAAPSTCAICQKTITTQQPSDGPVRHGEGVAHESCNSTFTDDLLTNHPPRGHRPRHRGE